MRVHHEVIQMTSSENSSKHMLETGSFGSKALQGPTIVHTILSVLALLVSIATLCVLAVFFYQFQSLNLSQTSVLTVTKAPYMPLPTMSPADVDKYDTFLFDVDGTLKNSNGFIPGSKEFIYQLKAKNKTVIIVSNSDWSTPEDRAKSMNVGVDASHIVVPLVVLRKYDSDSLRGKRILALAPPPVIAWLDQIGAIVINTNWNHTRGETTNVNGILATLNEKPEVVIIDSWSDYDMEAIDRIANILANVAVKFFILSTDASWRGEQNLIFSDGGSYYEAIKLITGRNATGYGKPSANMNNYLRNEFDLQRAIMFGDNLNTDFLMANQLGIDSCLMIGTGVHNEVDWRRYFQMGQMDRQPTYKGSFVQLV